MTWGDIPASAAVRVPAPLSRDRLAAFARRVRSASSATADLYFANSCHDLLDTGIVEQHAPTVFRAGRTLIVFRHDGGLSPLPAHDRLIYVIDDDWRAGIVDRTLPLQYRGKIAMIEGRAAVRLESAADVIVASSRRLAARLSKRRPDVEVVKMDPAWPDAQLPLADADTPVTSIAYLGAQSHAADFRFLIPILDRLMETDADIRLTVSGNHAIPQHWTGDGRVTVVPPLNWADYRSWMLRQRFDVALYPIGRNGFNRARSINKLMEYDQFGAAVIGSANWEAARIHAIAGACWLLPDSPDAWLDTLRRLRDRPHEARLLAARNRANLSATAPIQAQRAQWLDILGAALPARLGATA